jgi:hypothetical protein
MSRATPVRDGTGRIVDLVDEGDEQEQRRGPAPAQAERESGGWDWGQLLVGVTAVMVVLALVSLTSWFSGADAGQVPTPGAPNAPPGGAILGQSVVAYDAPGGAVLGAVEAGRGYELAGRAGAWVQVDVAGSGMVWLRASDLPGVDLPGLPDLATPTATPEPPTPQPATPQPAPIYVPPPTPVYVAPTPIPTVCVTVNAGAHSATACGLRDQAETDARRMVDEMIFQGDYSDGS